MIRSINKNIIIRRGINQVPQCVRRVALSELYISCHNVNSGTKDYQLRCALAIVTSWDGVANCN